VLFIILSSVGLQATGIDTILVSFCSLLVVMMMMMRARLSGWWRRHVKLFRPQSQVQVAYVGAEWLYYVRMTLSKLLAPCSLNSGPAES